MVHCAYAFMLAFSSLYMSIATPAVESKFVKKLSPRQLENYNTIREERLQIYLKSLVLSAVIGYMYYSYNPDVCYFLGITLTLTSMFYMMFPKSKYMIDSLTLPEQYKALNELSKSQKKNGIMSSLLGLLIWGVVYSRK